MITIEVSWGELILCESILHPHPLSSSFIGLIFFSLFLILAMLEILEPCGLYGLGDSRIATEAYVRSSRRDL